MRLHIVRNEVPCEGWCNAAFRAAVQYPTARGHESRRNGLNLNSVLRTAIGGSKARAALRGMRGIRIHCTVMRAVAPAAGRQRYFR